MLGNLRQKIPKYWKAQPLLRRNNLMDFEIPDTKGTKVRDRQGKTRSANKITTRKTFGAYMNGT